MSAINLLQSISVLGKTAIQNVSTVSTNTVVNLANSNSVLKINNITLTNYNANTTYCNVIVSRSGTDYYMGNSLSIPGQSVFALLGKDTSFYLEENDQIRLDASANSSITGFISYELMS